MNSKLILNIVVCFDDFSITYTPPLIIPLLPPSSSLKGKSHWISTKSHWDDGIQLVTDFEFTDQSHWPKKSMTFHTFVTKYTKVNEFRSMTLISAAPSKRAKCERNKMSSQKIIWESCFFLFSSAIIFLLSPKCRNFAHLKGLYHDREFLVCVMFYWRF